MNAPTELAGEFRLVATDWLSPSPTNPRKRKGLDVASLTALAATLKPPVGIIEPLVVREVIIVKDGAELVSLEIICGERRWRAAKIAGLTEVPCLVRTLSDLQVLHIQLIENQKREDLDELEEAEGYEKLMQTPTADGKPHTVDMIAAAMEVSKGTIYARLKLLALPQEGRQAFYDGKLDASRALLIARIPVQKIQLKVLEEAVEPDYYDKTKPRLSYRALKDLIERQYMLDLGRKVFDIKDATLLPKAGACTDCVKRTGNQPEIFDDVKNADICTDPTCYALKKTAAIKRLQEQAEAKGHEFIGAEKAKKLIPYAGLDAGDQLQSHGYAPLNDKIPDDPEGRTWNQAIKQAGLLDPRVAQGDEKKHSVQKVEIQNPYEPAKVIQAINIEDATKALREAGFEITLKSNAQNQPKARDAAKDKAKVAELNAVRLATLHAIHGQIEQGMAKANQDMFALISLRLADRMIEDLTDYSDEHEDVATILRLYIEDELTGDDGDPTAFIKDFRTKALPGLTPQQHFQLMAELSLAGQLQAWHAGSEDPKDMNTFARELGLAVHEIKQQAIKQHKADVAAKAKEEKQAAPAAGKGGKKAAKK